MNIYDIDKNFAFLDQKIKKNTTVHSVLEWPFSIHGLIAQTDKSSGYLRIPKDVAKNISDGVEYLNTNSAGGRLRFKTDSSYFAVIAKLGNISKMPHFAFAGSIGFDLYTGEHHVASFIPSVDVTDRFFGQTFFGKREMREYTLNFPLYSEVKELFIVLDNDAKLEEATPYRIEKPVVFYGSSITQGGCASRPGVCYPSILSRRFDFDYINLGFSGSAKGEQAMWEHIATLDMSAFVLDYDHNAPSAEHLKATHEPFFKAVRTAHPEIPIICLTLPIPFFFDIDERKRIIKTTVDNAKANGDKNVYYIDMCEYLRSTGVHEEASVDLCHPNDLGFFIMANAVGEILKNI